MKTNSEKVHKFSTMHTTGEKIDGLTGMAAILRYPFPDLDELAEKYAEPL